MPLILIVDDSPIDRRLASGILEMNGYTNLLLASDGNQAWQMIEKFRPAVVVTDMQMGGKDGLQLVTEMRRSYPQIPAILMTAVGSEQLAVQALHKGAASYVPKRVLAEELAETVARVLATSRDYQIRTDIMNRLTERTESYVVENDLNLIVALSRYLQQSLSDCWNLDPNDRIRVGTALEEALLNAFYHGNLEVSSDLKEIDHTLFHETAERRCHEEPYSSRKIHVQWKLSPMISEFHISDDGPGFDPAKLPDPTDPANLEKPCGRGVMLMQAFMDEVKYAGRGNECILIRRRFLS